MTRRDQKVLDWLKNYHSSLTQNGREEEAFNIAKAVEAVTRLNTTIERYSHHIETLLAALGSISTITRSKIVAFKARKKLIEKRIM